MELVTPDIGLAIWSSVAFLILLLLLRKFAWGPILSAVNSREDSIANALKAAEQAREEMKNLQADNDRILQEARAERDVMLKEAREMKEAIIAEAKTKASEEADRLIANAQEAIRNEKMAAITELKNQVAELSIEVAEKVLTRELSAENRQEEYVKSLVGEIKPN
jgi:F-type H+-transporting ATPase subunit b